MSGAVEFCLNRATAAEIAGHLSRCDADFMPPLSGRVEIDGYAHKIADRATRFEAWIDGVPIGLVAAYCNDSERRTAYITSVSVLQEWQGKGIAAQLMGQCIGHVKKLGFKYIELEVSGDNVGAARLYEKMGFIMNKESGRIAIMHLDTGKDA